MSENRYWFARRYPVGHRRNAMAPVTPEGWGVVRQFVGVMTGGAIAAVVLTLLGVWLGQSWLFVLAALAFVGGAAYGGWQFVSTATRRGDHQNTVEDYKAGRVK